MDKFWVLKTPKKTDVSTLMESLNINERLCTLLSLRGILSFKDAKKFFRPELNHLHNPFLMKGMKRAVVRILKAIEKHEKIMIYGDYDVDGTTSVALVFSFLKDNFPSGEFQYYIPHRYREGYGISTAGIDKAAADNCSLIIALDCGIKSVDITEYANQKNIDLIICDHHLPGEVLPNAFAILNPKQMDCCYPFKELSGCGIGFKLISAIAEKINLPFQEIEKYLDLVATSIAADIVPMNGENRILAFYGLKQINEDPSMAFKMIRETAAFEKVFTISDLVFIIAPRINAAGRMDDAIKAVQFFIEKDEEKSNLLALELNKDNSNRKELDQEITNEALKILEESELKQSEKSTVVFQPHWHKGVVGIVASRLIERYYKPTIVLTESAGKITGSARSVAGFNVYNAIHECSSLLENYGGHFFAAGLTMLPENLIPFQEKFEQIVAQTIPESSLSPTIEIDGIIDFKEITPKFFKVIQQLEPFGPENLRPVFLTKKVRNWRNHSQLLKDIHIKFIIAQDDEYALSGIGFNMADKYAIVEQGNYFDIVYTIEENEWNEKTSLQLVIMDIRKSEK